MPPSSRTSRLALAASACALALLAAACGTDTESDPTSRSTTSAASATSTTASSTTAPTSAGESSTASLAPTAASDHYPGAKGTCVGFAPSQIDAIFGMPGTLEPGEDCKVTYSKNSDDDEIELSVMSLSGNAFYGPKLSDFEAYYQKHPTSYTKVDGVGDSAYVEGPDYTDDGSIRIAKGDQIIEIELDLARKVTPEESKSILTALGKTAASRAPLSE